MPPPNHYSVELPWPKKMSKQIHESEKISFLDHSEYESNLIPGPGSYLVATHIGKKTKEYKFT